jgi:hypothetical protein
MARTLVPIAKRIAVAPVNANSSVARHRAAQSALRTLLKSPIEPPPAGYDPAKRYLLQLTRTVPAVPDDNGTMLRPSHLVEVSGAFAATLPVDAISGVVEL